MTAKSAGKIEGGHVLRGTVGCLQQAHDTGIGSSLGKLYGTDIALKQLHAVTQFNGLVFNITGFVQQFKIKGGRDGVQQAGTADT